MNLNVTAFDAAKQAATSVVADARRGLEALAAGLDGYHVGAAYTAHYQRLAADWATVTMRAYHLGHQPLPAQTEVIGAVNEIAGPRDVVVQAAGSLPGDLQMLFRSRDPKQYHVEYGYSCMGYEIAASLGIKMAAPDREVFTMVGDGSYLMMAQEIVTAVSEGLKLVIVLIDNRGFASIGSLSESVGSQRFGTQYRYRDPASGALDGGYLPVGPPTPGAWARTCCGPARSRNPRRARQGQGGVADHRRLHRDRSAGAGAVRGELVGRAGRGNLRPGQYPPGPRGLRGGEGPPAQLPLQEGHHDDHSALNRRAPGLGRCTASAARAGARPADVSRRLGQVVEIITKFPSRLGYVHIKQIDPAVLARAEAEDLGQGDAA